MGVIIQGGYPTGTGKGGDSIWVKSFEDECHTNNMHNKRSQVSMVNTIANMNWYQFFITYEQQPHLNNVYTFFGWRPDGWDVLSQMEHLPVECSSAKTMTKNKNKHQPLNPPVIKDITIHENLLIENNIIYITNTFHHTNNQSLYGLINLLFYSVQQIGHEIFLN